jgi:hypothetical protein
MSARGCSVLTAGLRYRGDPGSGRTAGRSFGDSPPGGPGSVGEGEGVEDNPAEDAADAGRDPGDRWAGAKHLADLAQRLLPWPICTGGASSVSGGGVSPVSWACRLGGACGVRRGGARHGRGGQLAERPRPPDGDPRNEGRCPEIYRVRENSHGAMGGRRAA